MRRGFSPPRAKVLQELGARQEEDDRRLPPNRSADTSKSFCHYNNAVYMGGMSLYKKHGKGILLHDDGSSVVTEYQHDSPTGQNIIFRENSISSVCYKTNVQFQVAYKQGKYIVTIPFSDSSFKAHGAGVLIDYDDYKIYRIVFKRGALVEKILHQDKRDNDEVFSRNSATKIIGVKHEQAFNCNFEKPSRVHIKHQDNRSTIGYFDEDGEMHGLSFTFYGENVRTSGEKSLYLKFIERGYYRDSNLETFGQKLFSNGNKYIGQFDKGEFHGYGILISPSEMKWVYGKFNQGQLNEIIDSNYKKFTEQEFEVWAQSLRSIHSRYRQRWIDLDIELPQQNYLYKTLKLAVESLTNYVDPDKTELIRDDEEKLNRIQQQFQKQQPGNMRNSYVQKELDRHYGNPKLLTKRQDYDEDIRRPYTPVNRFEADLPRKRQPANAEHYYREQDPFKFNVSKVPLDSEAEDYIERPPKQRPRVQSRQPLERRPLERQPLDQPILRSSRQKYLPYFYEPYDYGYRNKDLFHSYIDSVYNSTYYDELRRQRHRINRFEDDQLYYSRLRRGLETSPIHRNYYTTPPKYYGTPPKYYGTPPKYYGTPPKYQQGYPQRYVGRLTNKRNFNYDYDQNPKRPPNLTNKYPTTPKYFPNDDDEPAYQRTKTSPLPNSLYDSQGRNRNPSPEPVEDYSYPPKRAQSPREQQQSRKNFIKNNYQYWNTKS